MLRGYNNDSFHFFTYDGSWHQVNADGPYDPDNWYFVCGRVDASAASNNVSIWVNGEVFGQTGGGVNTSRSTAVNIGRNADVADRLFIGTIDDVRIYNHALSEAEILALYNQRVSPPEVTADPTIAPRDYVVEGTDVTITAVVEGTEPVALQWLKDGAPLGDEVANAVTNELSLPSVVLADAGAYSVVATSIYGAVTSEVATLTIGPAGAITFFEQPVGATRYINGNVTFSTIVVGEAPLSLQWTHNGANIAGATNETLTVSDIEVADGGDYVLVASNDTTQNSSATAALTVLVPVAGSYEEAVVNAAPIAYWRLEETGGTVAMEYMNGYNGAHIDGVTPGVNGPRPPDLPLMPTDNRAAGYDGESGGTDSGVSLLSARPAFTVMGWFNPAELPQEYTVPGSTNISSRVSLFGQNDVAEFGFHGTGAVGCWSPGGYVSFDPAGILESNKWYFIACTGDGDQMNLYVDAGRVSAVQNSVADYGSSAFPFRIGYGVLDASNNFFNGAIDDVAVYDRALSAQEISDIRSAAGPVPPVIAEQPVDATRYATLSSQFAVNVAGTLPIGYQWRKDGVPLADGGDISGATTPTLTIANLEPADAGAYDLVATNYLGSATSQSAALTVRVPEAGSYEEAVVARGPIAYWTLNETEDLIGYDYAGGYDMAHSDYTYVGDPGPQPPEFPGLADNLGVSWDGYEDDGSDAPASLLNNRAQFTIIGWMNSAEMPAVNAGGGDRVALFGQNDVAEFGFHGNYNLGIWSPGGGFASVNVSNTMSAGQWYYLAAVADGRTLRVYIDGVEQAVASGTVSTYGSSSYPFRIGWGVLDADGNNFYGSIDEVAVFNKALTASDIQTIYGLAADQFFPVAILTQPIDVTLYETSAAPARFSVLASGTAPLSYSWRKNGVPLVDGANVSGSQTATLTIQPVSAADQAAYDVVVSNDGSTLTSDAATLTILEAPVADTYGAAILDLDPAGYWPLNDPVGSAVAIEAWNGRNGTIRSNAVMGVAGVPGDGFPAGNTALQTTTATAADVALPSLGFNTNTVTISCWFYADGNQVSWSGLVVKRAGGVAGLHFGANNELHYTWTGDRYWGYTEGLVAPTNKWVYAALVVEPTQATLYMGVDGTLTHTINGDNETGIVHDPANYNNSPTYIGWDPNNNARRFKGTIDEVMIVPRALSPTEVQALYNVGIGAEEPVLIDFSFSAGDLTLSWPSGTLESAPEVTGTWSAVSGAASPFTITPSEPREFFRLAE